MGALLFLPSHPEPSVGSFLSLSISLLPEDALALAAFQAQVARHCLEEGVNVWVAKTHLVFSPGREYSRNIATCKENIFDSDPNIWVPKDQFASFLLRAGALQGKGQPRQRKAALLRGKGPGSFRV